MTAYDLDRNKMDLVQNKSDDMFDNVSVVRKSMLNFNESATEYGNVIYTQYDNETSLMSNGSLDFKFEHKEYIFDRTEVRLLFVTLYSLVFGCCFFGE